MTATRTRSLGSVPPFGWPTCASSHFGGFVMFESAFVPKAAGRPEPSYRLLWVVFGLCVLMFLHQLYDGWLGRQVSSRQPIGSIVKVTGEGASGQLKRKPGSTR